jgi:hypothetical protein
MRVFMLVVLSLLSCNKDKEVRKDGVNIPISKQSKLIDNHKKITTDTLVIKLEKLRYKIFDIRTIENNIDKRFLIVSNNKDKHIINLPTGEDYMGFSVNSIKDIGDGFEISIELGNYYYAKNFQFKYEKELFYLKKIETYSIDYKNENRKKEEIVILEKPISIDEFYIDEFIK